MERFSFLLAGKSSSYNISSHRDTQTYGYLNHYCANHNSNLQKTKAHFLCCIWKIPGNVCQSDLFLQSFAWSDLEHSSICVVAVVFLIIWHMRNHFQVSCRSFSRQLELTLGLRLELDLELASQSTPLFTLVPYQALLQQWMQNSGLQCMAARNSSGIRGLWWVKSTLVKCALEREHTRL